MAAYYLKNEDWDCGASMPEHLVPEELLAEYATGAASPGVSLLVAAQLTHSPEGRRVVQEYEQLGGVVLRGEPVAQMREDALENALAAIDAAPDAISDSKPRLKAGPLPAPVMERLGIPFEDIRWRFRLPGVAAHDFDGFGDEKVSLLRVKPGTSVPQHTHHGVEMTLVLSGCLEDGGVEYRAGDVAINDEDDDHRPRALDGEICYCLIVQRGDLHFTGTFSRFLNILGE